MEVAEHELERIARRAKRVIWAFRLIFYPGAAIIAILLLAGRSADADGFTTLRGKTGQGHEFILWVDDDRPGQFVTKIAARCPDSGGWYWLNWHRVDRDLISFDTDTGTIGAAYAWQGKWSDGAPANAEAHLNGHLDGDTVTGTLRLVDHRDGFDCDSGVVSFSAD